MKKIISVLLLIVLTISLSACNKSNNTSSQLVAGSQSDVSSMDILSQSTITSTEVSESTPSTNTTPSDTIPSNSTPSNSTPSKTEEPKPTVVAGEYTVTFDYGYDNIKTTAKSQNYKIEEPKTPVRNGFEFEGWYSDETKWLFSAFDVRENFTLKAKWSPKKYNISYKVNNENITTLYYADFITLRMLSNSNENEFNGCMFYYPTEEIIVFPINSPDFIGWTYSDNNVPINRVVIPAGDVYGDLEFVAHWK